MDERYAMLAGISELGRKTNQAPHTVTRKLYKLHITPLAMLVQGEKVMPLYPIGIADVLTEHAPVKTSHMHPELIKAMIKGIDKGMAKTKEIKPPAMA